MIYGIEQTTDRKNPETVVKPLRTTRQVDKWLSVATTLAFPGAASNDLPMDARNFHRRIRSAYAMPPGWRRPTRRQVEEAKNSCRGSAYGKSTTDVIADAIMRDGRQITVVAHG